MRRLKLVLLIAACAAVSACTRSADTPMAAPVSAPPASTATLSASPGSWVGRWQGPEGTFLEITGGPGTYSVTVQNLDGPRRFDAKAGTDTLVFTRDGVQETIRAGNGQDTGMKWLAEKRDCLVVKPGEGYCRD